MRSKKFSRIAFLLLVVMLLNGMTAFAGVGVAKTEFSELTEQTTNIDQVRDDIEKNGILLESLKTYAGTEGLSNRLSDDPSIDDKPERDLFIRTRIANGVGSKNQLPQERNKTFRVVIPAPEDGIKTILGGEKNLLWEYENPSSSAEFDYRMTSITVGRLVVTASQYNNNTPLGELTNDYDIFRGVNEITVAYDGYKKDVVNEAMVHITFMDELHKGINLSETTAGGKINFGSRPISGDDVEGRIVDGQNLRFTSKTAGVTGEAKYEIKNQVYVDSFVDGTLKFSQVAGTSLRYTVLAKPKELQPKGTIYDLGKINFRNEHNNTFIDKKIGQNISDKRLFIVDEKIDMDKVKESHKTYIDHMYEVEITNRVEGLPGYDYSKYYVNDHIKLVRKTTEGSLSTAMIGDRYEDTVKEDMTMVLKPGGTGATTVKFDFKRISYKVQLNNGEVQTLDVVKEDTSKITFDKAKVSKVTVGGVDYTGKLIDINSLGDKVIEVSSSENLKTLNYDVYNVFREANDFVTNLYKGREFRGLEGSIITVSPIRQHDHNYGEDIIIEGDYSQDEGEGRKGIFKLADKERKDIKIEVGKKSPRMDFYFSSLDKVRYQVLYITKYADVVSTGGNYQIDTTENDPFEILYESEMYFNRPGSVFSMNPKDFTKGNFELVEHEEFASQHELKGFEGFKVQYISKGQTINLPDEDTVYVYSYKKLVDNKAEVEIPLREVDKEGKDIQHPGKLLTYPRKTEDYKVEFSIQEDILVMKIQKPYLILMV